jgi:hypothetical protein
MVTVK